MPDTQEPLLILYSKFLMTYPYIRTKIIFGLQSTTEVDYKVRWDRFRDYKVRQSWIAKYDRVWIKKCDKNCKKWITKCDEVTNRGGLQSDTKHLLYVILLLSPKL